MNNIGLLKAHNTFFLLNACELLKHFEYESHPIDLTGVSCQGSKPDPLSFPHIRDNVKLKKVHDSEITCAFRQLRILALKIQGYSEKLIAQHLDCSIHNVKYHCKKILKRFNLKNYETLFTQCEANGILDIIRAYEPFYEKY